MSVPDVALPFGLALPAIDRAFVLTILLAALLGGLAVDVLLTLRPFSRHRPSHVGSLLGLMMLIGGCLVFGAFADRGQIPFIVAAVAAALGAFADWWAHRKIVAEPDVAGLLTDADLRRAKTRSDRWVLAELEHASSSDARNDDLAAAQRLLVSLDNQRQRVLRLFQLGEVDEAYLQKELEVIRTRRSPAEATVARLTDSAAEPQIPADPEEFAATCEALRERVEEEVEAGRLNGIAEAMQLSVTIEKTDDGASGVLEGVIPHEIGRFSEDFSHHCTNIGMTTWSCEKGCARLYLALSF